MSYKSPKTSAKGDISPSLPTAPAVPSGLPALTPAQLAARDAFNAWMAKYGPVEREIIEARDRRLAKKAERRAERPWIFGTLCELTDGAAKAWRSQGLSLDEQIRLAEGDSAVISFLIAYYGRSMTREIDKMRHQLKRPFYYEAENQRRRTLAAMRRRIKKRRTSNACPTREQVLDAWIHLKDSHEATIRFGSLMEDLACYVDHALRFDDDGNIVGRNGGIKAWLQENVPALALRYTTVMRYKAAARKLRQIAEIEDPTPADAIVGRVARPGCEHGVRSAKPAKGAAAGVTQAVKGVTQVVKGGGGAPQAAGGGVGSEIMLWTKGWLKGEVADQTGGGQEVEAGNEIMLRTKSLRDSEMEAATGHDAVQTGRVTVEGENMAQRQGDGAKRQGDAAHGQGNGAKGQVGGAATPVEVAMKPENVTVEIVRARAIWLEVVAGIKPNPTALVARINGLVDPRQVTEATMLAGWRERYNREITQRTKKSWLKRLMVFVS